MGFAAFVLVVVASVPLVVVRRAPLVVFLVMVAANAGLHALGVLDGFAPGPTFALYFVAVDRDPGTAASVGTSALVFGSIALLWVTDRLDNAMVDPVFSALIWLGVWYVGHWVRQRREAGAEQERRAEQDQRLAVAEERTRIARDLHDSAGHAINVILVQAGGARLQLDRDPGGARTALETIEGVARDTLVEIDRLVTALRDDPGADGDHSDDAVPGLSALDRLVERTRAAGLDVTVDVVGTRIELPFGVDRAAYRILQEALTNAARHGDGSAHVTIASTADAVDLTATNPVAPGVHPTGSGHGIIGMRERAALLGGHLTTGLEAGRFRVAAHLPVDPARP